MIKDELFAMSKGKLVHDPTKKFTEFVDIVDHTIHPEMQRGVKRHFVASKTNLNNRNNNNNNRNNNNNNRPQNNNNNNNRPQNNKFNRFKKKNNNNSL
jgi:hypothetical protein